MNIMKYLRLIITILAVAISFSTLAAEKSDKKPSGPKGGRLLEKTVPQAEIVIAPDRTVTVNFYDANLKPVPAANQVVVVTADAKSGKKKVEFEKKGESLVGKTKLPDGDNIPVIVQVKQDEKAKPQNFRFNADMSICSSCQLHEYACVCHE